MNIREFKPEDKAGCLDIFDSNCPLFFAEEERNQFVNWLDFQSNINGTYKSPTYNNAEQDLFYVVELPKSGVIACGGFYIVRGEPEARLAWGMVHANYHKQGIGTKLFQYRESEIKQHWPNHIITLGTSQHTYPFYEKMGMQVIASFENGYGKDLDRFDMKINKRP